MTFSKKKQRFWTIFSFAPQPNPVHAWKWEPFVLLALFPQKGTNGEVGVSRPQNHLTWTIENVTRLQLASLQGLASDWVKTCYKTEEKCQKDKWFHFHAATAQPPSKIRGLEKGLAGGGWRPAVPKIQRKYPQNCVLLFGVWEGFPCANPLSKCTTASQPQSLAIFWIADEIARDFRSEKQIWPFFIAERIATATVSLLQKNRLLESGQSLWAPLAMLALQWNPQKIAAYSFDRVNESQTSTANHRRETVHLAPSVRQPLFETSEN